MIHSAAYQQRAVDILFSLLTSITIHICTPAYVSFPPGVNGFMFRRRQFVICKTDVAFWHIASVGAQKDFLSVYFTGNLFQHQGVYRSVLTLFPMSGMTVSMEPEVIGKRQRLTGSA